MDSMSGPAGRFSPASFTAGAVLAALLIWIATSFRLVRVTGDAMSPTYVRGDIVLVSAVPYRHADPRRGDVALMHYPLDPANLLLDRVVAIEGDTLRIVGGRVYLNERPFADDAYVLGNNRGHVYWGPAVTPQGYLFVLGDNRNASSDSRHWGFVPRRYVWGRVIGRIWRSRGSS